MLDRRLHISIEDYIQVPLNDTIQVPYNKAHVMWRATQKDKEGIASASTFLFLSLQFLINIE